MLIRTLLFCLLTLWHLLGSFAVQASAPLYHCNVIDFNGPEAGYGHHYPLTEIYMGDGEPHEDVDLDVVFNYFREFFDRSKQVTVLSGNNLAEVIAQCTDFVEQNDQFVVYNGWCELTDMHGNYYSGTVSTLPGVSRFQRRDEGSQFDVYDLTDMPWEMVYWQYVACDIQHPIFNIHLQILPLPFVITYDDKDECEPGCPTEHGVDAFDGSVRKPISPLDAAQRLSNTHVGALAGLQQYLPLDFYYATDVSAHAKPVAEVNANWISKHDVRLSAEGSSPYTDPAWPGYNWAGNDLHNISIWRPDGSYSVFYYVNYPGIVGGWYAAHAAEKGRLMGNGSAFVYTSANGDEERFSHGRLTKVIKRDGTRISFNRMSDEHMHYSIRKGAEPLHQASVLRQGDAQGYRYLMEYAGETYQFVFDHSHRLLRMRKPTGVADEFSEITFHYQEPANSKLLTSVTDEQGQTILRYRYDAYGRVVESATAGQGPASTIDYHADGTRTVQDSSGKIQHYQFEQDRISRVTCISCGDTVVRHRYSSTFMGKRKTTTDSKGTVTTLERDQNGLLTSKTERTSDRQRREAYYSWDTERRLLLSASEQGITTRYSYTPEGWVSSVVRNHAWQESYDYDEFGNLLSIDGPRTDLQDISHFSYNSQGLLETYTNALGQLVHHAIEHDAAGRPTKVMDANGQLHQYQYNARGQLLQSSTSGGQVQYEYDAAGLLSAMTNAAGVRFTYQYDAVGQLIAVIDSKGNQQHFEYDEQRDLVRIFFTDPSGDLTFQQQYEYDGQSQLIRVQSLQAEEQLSYNVDGKPVQRQDALNAVEAFRYDGFNRLIKHIDKQGNATEFRYDNSDQLSRVTDAEGKATSYYYDNFNQLRQLISPDSGTSSFSYDAAGNRTSVTDARGIELQYQYDALNRLIRVQHSGGAEHIELRYDEQHGIHPAVGQLTSVTDSIGETQYQYTEHGQLALARHQLGANWYSLGYSYEHGERLKRVTLPSGSQLVYDYDSTGRIHKLSLQQLHGLQTLVSDIRYLPFGPIKSLHYGHGLTLHNEYDTDYKLVSRQLGSMLALGYQYDALNNITAIEQPLYGVSSEFGYDSLSRLISEFPAGRQFSYDSIGNRLRKEQAAGVTEYIYQPASHRLAERSGQHATLYQYDAAGNMVQRGAQQFEYNAFGRMAEVTTPERELSYRYNFKGQRAEKIEDGQSRYYLYNQDNLLVAEIAADGTVAKEYIYLEGEPLAMLVDGQLYYYHNSHLGTPLLLSDAQQQVVWQAEYSGFGKAEVQVAIVENQLRFPGQYFDEETGLHYNYFRDYDPETGRYLQSDPIGLAGGINTYGYVGGNPVNLFDFFGLSPEDVRRINAIFKDAVNRMTNNGQRISPGPWNNFNRSIYDVTGGAMGKPYFGCWEQANELLDQLNDMSFDDDWSFRRVDRIFPFPHSWVEGSSSNPTDPYVTADPWRDTMVNQY